MKPDVSIIVPSFNIQNIPALVASIEKSCKRYTWELCVVSPFVLPESLQANYKVVYARDFGNPARAFCIGATLATGHTIFPQYDDAKFCEDAIDLCLDQYYRLEKKYGNALLNLIYTEGDEYRSNSDPREINANQWFKAWTHSDLRLEGVGKDWWISLLFLMGREFYNSIGGLDSENFEVMNANLHDLLFRTQRVGVHYEHSIVTIARLECQYGRTVDNSPIIAAYLTHDKPMLEKMYATAEAASYRSITIDLFNWKKADNVWSRRWSKV